MRAFLSLVLALFTAACASVPRPVPKAPAPIVILVSIDGFRYDYFDRFRPPTLEAFARSGVRSEGLIPQFPSKTFPNHYTLVTGMRLGRHGIVSNNMIAPGFKERFSMSNRAAVQDAAWWGGEPIWNTVERQGGIAAAMFWPGSEAPIGGRRATYWMPYDDHLPHPARVAQILEWLRLPEGRRPSFLTLYFSDVDNAGHDDGPEAPGSTVVRDAVLKVDASLSELRAGVRTLGLEDRVNWVIVSDHGMSQLSADRVIRLDDYVDSSKMTILDTGPVLALAPNDGDVEGLYEALRGRHPRMKVYRSRDIPARFRLAGHPRVQPIMAIADDGWYIAAKNETDRWRERGVQLGGTHGYDPKYRTMHGLFIAAGPRIRAAGLVRPLENIHVYEFMCAILGLRAAPNDGDLGKTANLIR